jgi:glyoxylase-like metal-dependent hydrolase (beta-lactamase superfamily II)
VYLIDDDPLTLVDTGPRDVLSLSHLETGLLSCGFRVEDLERIVITHQHLDHWGLAQLLSERSGAEVWALAGFDSWLSAWPRSQWTDDHFADELVIRHGILAAGHRPSHRDEHNFAAPVARVRPMRQGAKLESAGRSLRVLHRPGHSRSDTVLYDERRRMLFGGDHLLPWRSVPILSPPLDGAPERQRPRALLEYRASLQLTADLPLDLILPGHGEPISSPRDVIAARLLRYDQMTERVRAEVGTEPLRAMEIAARVRGPVATESAFFVLCDTLGFLDELIDAGSVAEVEVDGIARFAMR